jgi:nickel-dependent lactate racemase
MSAVFSAVAAKDAEVSVAQLTETIAQACPAEDYRNQRVLLIIPDATRTAPVGLVFKTLFAQIGPVARKLDILVALGTHQPMSEAAIQHRLEMTDAERTGIYRHVQFFNHAWDDPSSLKAVGTIAAEEIHRLSGGLFSMDVPVSVNRRLFDYDRVILIGPVFPHEVAGFSGGNKYLFPGVSGPEVLNFFHWLGAVVTSPRIIGQKWTPVRAVIDKAGSMVAVDKFCCCMVVDGSKFAGFFAGSPEQAWDAACELSREHNITFKDRPFHTILSCAPAMYDELWTGAKCMYKLEPVLADGGELIIYAPHIHDVCVTHRQAIETIGYHCRDYFLKQWDRFRDYPWGVLAHSTHVHGVGTYEDGVEHPRARVTLATGISREKCTQINLRWRDPSTIRPEDYANREDEGILLVPKAGEKLFQLHNPPSWARNTAP